MKVQEGKKFHAAFVKMYHQKGCASIRCKLGRISASSYDGPKAKEKNKININS